MKVILIEEDRFAEIAKLMKHEVAESAAKYPQGFPEGMTKEQRVNLAENIHRCAHFHFVRWAQSHGASCVER